MTSRTVRRIVGIERGGSACDWYIQAILDDGSLLGGVIELEYEGYQPNAHSERMVDIKILIPVEAEPNPVESEADNYVKYLLDRHKGDVVIKKVGEITQIILKKGD